MTEAFADHRTLFLTLHILGVVVGMGGASIADVLFFDFLRDFRISRKEADVLRVLSRVILASLVLLLLSGAALYVADPARLSRSPAFLAKAAILVLLTANGMVMHVRVLPHLVELSFRKRLLPHGSIARLHILAFALGAVSMTSWYAVFFLAMLKSYLPSWSTASQIIGIYLMVVAAALLCSQAVRTRYARRMRVE